MGAPKRAWAIALALLLGSAALYAPSVRFGFVFDDLAVIRKNALLAGGLSPENVVRAFTSVHEVNWVPLAWVSHLLDVRFFGFEPRGHHAVNVLLHAVNAALLFLVLRAYTGAVWRSAWAAALFAAHPLNVETVAWVSERKSLLSTLFGLLALAAYLGYARRPGSVRYLAVAASLALGLMAKPMLVTLPFVLLLLDLWPLGRREAVPPGAAARPGLPWRPGLPPLREKVPLVALALLAAGITLYAQGKGGALRTLGEYPLRIRVGNAAACLPRYLGKTAVPTGLSAFYPHPSEGLSWAQAAFGAAFVAAATLFAAARAKRLPFLAVGWLWFLGTLVPVIGLVQVGGQAMADRYAYVPLIGIFLAAAWGMHAAAGRPPRGRAALAAGAVLALAPFLPLTRAQLAHWETDETLFRHAVAVDPANWVARTNLGQDLVERGRFEEGMAQFREAIRTRPDYALARFNLGAALEARGDTAGASRMYAQVLRLDAGSAPAHYNLGSLLLGEGRRSEALGHFEEALRIEPAFARAWNNRGVALLELGRPAEAEASFARAAALAPADPVYARNLAAARRQRSR